MGGRKVAENRKGDLWGKKWKKWLPQPRLERGSLAVVVEGKNLNP